MPVYNAENFLASAIESILGQTYEDFELLMINDGSTDRSEEIALSYHDKRVRYEKNDANLRLVATLNTGIDSIDSEFIARMDADDLSEPDRLDKQIQLLDQRPDVHICGTWIRVFGHRNGIWQYEKENSSIKAGLFFKSIMPHATVVMRTQHLNALGIRYSEEHIHMEDADLWARLYNDTVFHNLQEPLYKYRREGQNITVKNSETKVNRETAFFRRIMSIHGFPVDEKKLRSLVTSNSSKKLTRQEIVDNIELMNNIWEWNKKNELFDSKALNRVIQRKANRLFYKSCNSGWATSKAYLKLKPTANPAKLYYLIRKMLGNALRNR